MSLKTKDIKKPKSLDDGLRISIMSRHTLDDGVTPDQAITPDLYDQWWRELAPPDKLIGSYYKRGLSWKEFSEQFKAYLQSATANDWLIKLIELAKLQNVTILCIEDKPDNCHRKLVAQRCAELDRDLKIIIE